MKDQNMIKIQALEELQKIIFNRSKMLYNACYTKEAENIYYSTYGERSNRLFKARNRAIAKAIHYEEFYLIISQQIMKLCKE